MEYKKGQWYEVFGNFPATRYLKFKEKRNREVYFTGRIRRDYNDFEDKTDYTTVLENEYMKEVSLEVISPYLPEGHPDKLPEKDKYYYVEQDSFFMIGKVDIPLNEEDSDKDIFRGSCHYFIAKGYQSLHRGESWCYKDYNRTFRLATQEEIDWLEYCNKIDKYVTKEEFLKQTKIMKKEPFTIEGPESLKRAFVEEVNTFHRTGEHCCAISAEGNYSRYLGCYKEHLTLTDIKEKRHFKLPQDWDKAIQACKDFWKVKTKKSLYFGDVEFICDKEAKAAATSYGKVTLEDIEKIFDHLYHTPKLVGYSLDLRGTTELIFGCKKGKITELEAIADFLRS